MSELVMPKKEGLPGMIKLAVVLAIYAAASCVGLALVFNATQERIASNDRIALEAALRDLFPEADGFEEVTGEIEGPGEGGIKFGSEYRILQGGSVIGAAIQASGPSYGGDIVVLAGIGADSTIKGVKILSHSDTPGLGANAAAPKYYVDKPNKITFYGQFTGMSVDSPFEVKAGASDIQSITASTITSRAVANVVRAAARLGYAWLSGGVAADVTSGASEVSEGSEVEGEFIEEVIIQEEITIQAAE